MTILYILSFPTFQRWSNSRVLNLRFATWMCVTTDQGRFSLLRHDECEKELEDDQEASQGSLLTTLW